MISIGQLHKDLLTQMEGVKPTVLQPEGSYELSILRCASKGLHAHIAPVRSPRTRVGKRGRLEGIEVSLFSYDTGLHDSVRNIDIEGLAIVPDRSTSDFGAAMIERDGRVTAAYYNIPGAHLIGAEWNTEHRPIPKWSADILHDLIGTGSTIKHPSVLFGLETAVRYLLETPTGVPLCYFTHGS